MMEAGGRRCPSCGALAAWEAEWCGQCLTPLGRFLAAEPEPPPDPEPASHQEPQFFMDEPRPVPAWGASFTMEEPAAAEPSWVAPPAPVVTRGPTWPCAVCETENPIELDTCAACGASFSKLFSDRTSRPSVDPKSAVARSLLFPGLGQIHCGRTADGVSRAVLYLWTSGTAAVMLLARSSALTTIGILFLLTSFLLYASSALDAYRLAAGEQPYLTPRYLLYGTVGLIMLSVGSLFLLVSRAAQLPH